MGGWPCVLPPGLLIWRKVWEVVKMYDGSSFIGINVVQYGGSLSGQRPSNHVGDVLAMRCRPVKDEGQMNVRVEGTLEGKTHQGPVAGVEWDLSVGSGGIHRIEITA